MSPQSRLTLNGTIFTNLLMHKHRYHSNKTKINMPNAKMFIIMSVFVLMMASVPGL